MAKGKRDTSQNRSSSVSNNATPHQHLDRLQQLQLFKREVLAKILQTSSNSSSLSATVNEQITEFIDAVQFIPYSSVEQEQAFEQLCIRLVKDFNLKKTHSLEKKTQELRDEKEREKCRQQVNELYQLILAKVQPETLENIEKKNDERRMKKLIKEKREDLQRVYHMLSDESLKECVSFLKREEKHIKSNSTVSIDAIRVHLLIFQFVCLGTSNKILETKMIKDWILTLLEFKEIFNILQFLGLELLSRLMIFYRESVTRESIINYQNTMVKKRKEEMELKRKQQQKEKKIKEREESEDEDSDIEKDLEEEDDVYDASNANLFDEESKHDLLTMKQQLINDDILRAITRIASNKEAMNYESISWNLEIYLCIQTLNIAFDTTKSQDRFEQIVDRLLNANIANFFINLFNQNLIDKAVKENPKVIDTKLDINYRETIEHALLMMSSILNHENAIRKLFEKSVADSVVKVLLSFTSKEIQKPKQADEHNICEDIPIVSLCCYLLAKFGSISNKIPSSIVQKYCLNQQIEGSNLLQTLISLVKYRKQAINTETKAKYLININAYAALASLLQCQELADQIIASEVEIQSKNYSLIKTIVSDIGDNKTSWELRYGAMIVLKHLAALLKANPSAAPIYSRLLESGLLGKMSSLFKNSGSKNTAKKNQKRTAKDTQDKETFIFQRYTMPALLAAIYSLFQNARLNGSESNVEKLKITVSESTNLQEVLEFLTMMERRKVDSSLPYWLIIVLVSVFVLFLVVLPFLARR